MVHEGLIRRSEDAFSDEISRGMSAAAIVAGVRSDISFWLWLLLRAVWAAIGGVCDATESSSSSLQRLLHMQLPVLKMLAVSILMVLRITWLKCHACGGEVLQASQRMMFSRTQFGLLFVRTNAAAQHYDLDPDPLSILSCLSIFSGML